MVTRAAVAETELRQRLRSLLLFLEPFVADLEVADVSDDVAGMAAAARHVGEVGGGFVAAVDDYERSLRR